MKVLVKYHIVFIATALCGYEVISRELPPSATETTLQLARRAGFSIEEHPVTTSDGYVIKMYRLPARRKGWPTKSLPPVMLFHGMIGSSSDFMLLGRKKSLAFLLADAGYDVFIGNMRFNQYSSHPNMSRTDPAYWNFSLDEHGLLDLPAQMDEILAISKAPKVHFIGYSLGATAYVMMCDRRPDLAKKFLSFVALAPAIHMSSLAFYSYLMLDLRILDILASMGINPLTVGGPFQKQLASNLCRPRMKSEDMCYALVFMFVGEDYGQVDWEMGPSVIARMQPASVNQLRHFLQLGKKDGLRQFDFGSPDRNILKYGKPDPPEYNTTANTAPVVIFYGKNDYITPARGVDKLAKEYRRAKTLMWSKSVEWDKFNHYDFIYAKDLGELVNKDVVKILNNITRSQMDNET